MDIKFIIKIPLIICYYYITFYKFLLKIKYNTGLYYTIYNLIINLLLKSKCLTGEFKLLMQQCKEKNKIEGWKNIKG